MGGPPKARFRAPSTLLSKRAARGRLSHLFSHFFFIFRARDFASQRVSSLGFLFLLAGRLPRSPAFPATRSPSVRFIFSSTQPRLLASVHFLGGLAKPPTSRGRCAVTSEHTLLNRVRARTVSCARVAMISTPRRFHFVLIFFFSSPRLGQ